MRLTKILIFFLTLIFIYSCASTEDTLYETERKAKIDKLKNECDFVSVEYIEGEEIYICNTSGSRIKKSTAPPAPPVENEIKEKEIPEQPANG